MSTALELSRKEWKTYLEAASRREALPELTPEEHDERERLLGRIKDAAVLVKARFGAKKVVLFGSLAHAGWFVHDSDVDLAVEGLIGDEYWKAWGLVEEIIKDRPVDFIDIETARESLKRAIERYGIEL
jgi:predicted nucleotidyltransferase